MGAKASVGTTARLVDRRGILRQLGLSASLQRQCCARTPPARCNDQRHQRDTPLSHSCPLSMALPSFPSRLALLTRLLPSLHDATPLTPPASAPELGSPLPHLHLDWACNWAYPSHSFAPGQGLSSRTSASRLSLPPSLPQLHRDRAHSRHISTGTGIAAATSALRVGLTPPSAAPLLFPLLLGLFRSPPCFVSTPNPSRQGAMDLAGGGPPQHRQPTRFSDGPS